MNKLNVSILCHKDEINKITIKALSALKIKHSVLSDVTDLPNSIAKQNLDVIIVHESFLKTPDFICTICNEEFGSHEEPGIVVLIESTPTANMLSNLNGVVCEFLSLPFTIESLWNKLRKASEQRAFSTVVKAWIKETRSAQNALRAQMVDFMDRVNALMGMEASPNSRVSRNDNHVMQTLRPVLNSLLVDAQRDASLKRYEPQLKLLQDCIEDFGIHDCTENLLSSSKFDVPRDNALSKREIRIMAMIKIGMTTEEIAVRLNIASDTVKTHRRNIRKKLELTGNKRNLNAYLQAI